MKNFKKYLPQNLMFVFSAAVAWFITASTSKDDHQSLLFFFVWFAFVIISHAIIDGSSPKDEQKKEFVQKISERAINEYLIKTSPDKLDQKEKTFLKNIIKDQKILICLEYCNKVQPDDDLTDSINYLKKELKEKGVEK